MPDWKFGSRITSPDGIEVTVSITIPRAATWGKSGCRVDTESALPPIAQMAAADAMKQINDAKNEVPF